MKLGTRNFIKILTMGLLLGSASVWAAPQTIQCSNGQCQPSFAPNLDLEKPLYSSIDVGNTTADINVSVPTGQTPRSLRLSLINGMTPRNLSVNLSSSNPSANSGNSIVIGDMFNSLSLSLNGFNGTNGSDASQICATNIKNGNYGDNARLNFNSRRANDATIDPTRCDHTDLLYLQNNDFTCDDPSYTAQTSPDPTLNINRIPFKAACTGVLTRNLCVEQTTTVTCTYQAVGCKNVGYQGSGSYNCQAGGNYTLTTYVLPVFISTSVYTYEGAYDYSRQQSGPSGFCFGSAPPPALHDYGFGNKYYVYQGYNVYGWNYVNDYPTLTSPGLDPTTYQPLPGSSWTEVEAPAFQACAAPNYTVAKVNYISEIAYVNDQNSCPLATSPDDPSHLITWTYSGMVQETSFGNEVLQCSLEACPVQAAISDLPRYIDQISPGNGSSGTQQGQGIALIYDAATISTSATLGSTGGGGKSDLAISPTTQVCTLVHDSVSDPGSAFAKAPTVSFRRYSWQPLVSTGGGNSGNPPAPTNNSVQVFRKMDSSVRYLLSKDLL